MTSWRIPLAPLLALGLAGCNYRPPSSALDDDSFPVPAAADRHVNFGSRNEHAELDLRHGWAMRTQRGRDPYRWMTAIEADLALDLDPARAYQVWIRAAPLWQDWRQQTMGLYVNNRHVADWVMADHHDPRVYTAPLPARFLREGSNQFTFRAGYVAPAPGVRDRRTLSICMFDLLIQPVGSGP